MSRTLFPPRFAQIDTDILLADMPEKIKITWLKLRALAWGRDETPVLTEQQFCDLLNVSRSTFRSHISQLRVQDTLFWRCVRAGTMQFFGFGAGVFAGTTAQINGVDDGFQSEKSDFPTTTVLNINNDLNDFDSVNPVSSSSSSSKTNQFGINGAVPVRKIGQQSEKSDNSPKNRIGTRISDALMEQFSSAGVSKSFWGVLAEQSHCTAEYVAALAAQIRDEYGSNQPRILYLRIMENHEIPEYCAECGGIDGNHAGQCEKTRMKFLDYLRD